MPEIYDENGIYKEGELVLIEGEDYAAGIVFVKQTFSYQSKWQEWDKETGKKHRSVYKFYDWLIEKGVFVPIDYKTFELL